MHGFINTVLVLFLYLTQIKRRYLRYAATIHVTEFLLTCRIGIYIESAKPISWGTSYHFLEIIHHILQDNGIIKTSS